ncbi:hypothetical protein [Clostridium sp. UBA1652]|uniref:hypothetical protein n=1 Tax=Clostridium sp. UBA1652 TaxID=1946348 RepID=UPI0025794E45|nr:hypothetical protein [Clostridium sp. UBA1652]
MKRKHFVFLSTIISILIISILVYRSMNTVNVVNIPINTLDKIFSENIKAELNKREDLRAIFIDEIDYTREIFVCEEKGNKVYIHAWLNCSGHSSDDPTLTKAKYPAIITLKKDKNDYIFDKLELSTLDEGSEAIKIFPYRIRNNYIKNKNM